MITIYFSGTGNTKFVAKSFSKITNSKSYSIEDNVDFKKLIEKHTTIALCYPIYFSRAPIYYTEFIKKHKSSFKNKKIIVFCTQQFFSGDGARSILDELEDVEIIYTKHFNMQNNITSFPTYYKLTKINNKRCLDNTYKKLTLVANDIEKGKVKLKGFNFFSKQLGKIQALSPDKIKTKQEKAVKVNSNCILCDICVKECPTNTLENIENKITAKNSCTFCFRCVNVCPKQAITVLIHGSVNEQYDIRGIFEQKN